MAAKSSVEVKIDKVFKGPGGWKLVLKRDNEVGIALEIPVREMEESPSMEAALDVLIMHLVTARDRFRAERE